MICRCPTPTLHDMALGAFSRALSHIFREAAPELPPGLRCCIGPLGPIGFATQRSIDQTLWGLGDLYPQMTLRWDKGVHNFMVYGQAYVPVGAYDPMRIANLGIDHWALDGGFGYTYLNPATGWEASAVTGFTYNFRNPYTDYQNGVDWRLDWGTSLDQSPQSEVGSVHADY